MLRRANSTSSSPDSNSNKFPPRRTSALELDYETQRHKTVETYLKFLQRKSSIHIAKEKDQLGQLEKDVLEKREDFEKMYKDVLALTRIQTKASDKGAGIDHLLTYFTNSVPSFCSTALAKDVNLQNSELILKISLLSAVVPPFDANGKSDPFCRIYMKSNKNVSHTSKICYETLNPIWEEEFVLCVTDPKKDLLCVEVWDYDEKETISDTLKRGFEIGSSKAIGSFFRELSRGGKKCEEFIGKVVIPLRTISVFPTDQWWSLEQSNKNYDAKIHLKFSLGMQIDEKRAIMLYSTIYQYFAIRDIVKCDPLEWCRFSDKMTEETLDLINFIYNLKKSNVILTKWKTLIKINAVFSIDWQIFPELVVEIFGLMFTSAFDNEEIKQILDEAKQLLESMVSILRKSYNYISCPETAPKIIYVFKTLHLIGVLADKLRMRLQQSVPLYLSLKNVEIEVAAAGKNSAEQKFSNVLTKLLKPRDADTVSSKIEHATSITNCVHLFCENLEKSLMHIVGSTSKDSDSSKQLRRSYYKAAYEVFDIELEILCNPFISEYCQSLKMHCGKNKNRFSCIQTENENGSMQEMPKRLFFLYLALKKFAELAPKSSKSKPKTESEFKIKSSFHLWFSLGVSHFIELMSQYWISLMKNAIKIDFASQNQTFQQNYPDSNTAWITTSAVDSVQIFSQIQAFWDSLGWPFQRQGTILVKKLVKELLGFSGLYAQIVAENLKDLQALIHNEEPFILTPRMCTTINNIVYVKSFTKEIIERSTFPLLLKDVMSESCHSSFAEKQKQIHDNGLEIVISSIISDSVDRMQPTLQSHIERFADASDDRRHNSPLTILMDYIGSSLEVLDKNILFFYYRVVVNAVFGKVLKSVRANAQSAMEKQKSCTFFKNLQEILEIMKPYFEQAFEHKKEIDGALNIRLLFDAEMLQEYGKCLAELKILGLTVPEIKSEYFSTRYKSQGTKDKGRGLISVKMYYNQEEEKLEVEVLNGRKLMAMDKNGTSDPFVEVQLLPEDLFPNAATFTTKVIKKNLFPIFDEKFSITVPITIAQAGCWIHFLVYDYDFVGSNDFLGESYYPMTAVKKTKPTEQEILPLSSPTTEDLECLKCLVRKKKELKRFSEMELKKMEAVKKAV